MYGEVKSKQPALIILDIRVGNEQSGWAFLDLVALDPATAHIPAIVCSTDTRLLAAKATYLEAQGYLALEKPFHIEDLLEKVTRVLGPPT